MFYSNSFSDTMGYYLDFQNPKTLNEKIQILKLYDRTSLHTLCADKISVRKYVEPLIGNEKLVPIVKIFNDIDEFNVDLLPDFPVIIKANHDSGSTIIVDQSYSFSTKELKDKFKIWLKRNYYNYSREWQYKNIEPKIFIEKLLLNSKNQIPSDIKAHCINGKVEFLQIDIGRGSNNHFRDFYFPNWEKAPFTWNEDKNLSGDPLPTSDIILPRPIFLDELILLSEKLSTPFSYVRIDWYDCGEKFYFGEITFHHDSGYVPILPKKWDIYFGEKIKFKKP